TLIPKYADWAIELFKDPVVIAFTDKSRYTNEITAQNWYKILLKPEITYGYANPALAPIGYHTLIVWQLADAYYNEKIKDKKISELLEAKCPQDYIRPDVPELIPLIESMSLDYLFIYRSTAQQHNLKFIELPDEINLGNDKFSENYKKASVTITDAKGKSETRYGKPVIFAFTILKDAPNKETALKFAGLLLSKTGRQIFKQNFQPLMEPVAAINGENLPAELKQ
ncbi:MAG: extracellular solute-binding protein, partial [Candidatus Omnitrophica bacterium]|nr:extracellular solute-binding protein [Candidatus Omnitrophota bacterium]